MKEQNYYFEAFLAFLKANYQKKGANTNHKSIFKNF